MPILVIIVFIIVACAVSNRFDTPHSSNASSQQFKQYTNQNKTTPRPTSRTPKNTASDFIANQIINETDTDHDIVTPLRQKSTTANHCIISNPQRGTKQWNELRHGKVTGSSAFFLKDHSVSQAIAEGQKMESSIPDSVSVRRALRLKPLGAAEYARRAKITLKSASFISSSLYSRAGFSPDGITLNHDNSINTIILVKAFNRSHHLSCYRHIDEKVYYQLQFGLFVSEANHATLVLYNPDCRPGEQLLVRNVERDPSIQKLFERKFNYR